MKRYRVISDQTSFLIWEKEGKVHILHHEWRSPLSSDKVDIEETLKMFTERAKCDFIAEVENYLTNKGYRIKLIS